MILLGPFTGQQAISESPSRLVCVIGLSGQNHVRNLFLFHYANCNPGQLSGTVTMGHELSLYSSDVLYRSMLIPLALVAFTFPSPFAFGALVSPGILYIHHKR